MSGIWYSLIMPWSTSVSLTLAPLYTPAEVSTFLFALLQQHCTHDIISPRRSSIMIPPNPPMMYKYLRPIHSMTKALP